MSLKYPPIEGEQLQMMNEIAAVIEKYKHLIAMPYVVKDQNVIYFELVCNEEPYEVDDTESYVLTVEDVDLSYADYMAERLSDEMCEYLDCCIFTERMPAVLGMHLLECAGNEKRPGKAEDRKPRMNGHSISLMMLAMRELDLMNYPPSRADMEQVLQNVFGTDVFDKHTLDYFYSPKESVQVRKKIEHYKSYLGIWLQALEASLESND